MFNTTTSSLDNPDYGFNVSKLLIGETKNDSDHEYIICNSLIYNTDNA